MGGKKTGDKSREWEKERREKLNVAFNDLFKLLPDHDPSISLSKVDILRKAAEYIRLLQEQNDEIIKSSDCHVLRNEADRLKKRVTYLLMKTKELVTALRDAGVPIPKPKTIRKRKTKNSVKGKDQNQVPSPSGASSLATTASQFVISNTTVPALKTSSPMKKGKCGCTKEKKSPLTELNPTNAPLPGTSLGTNVTVIGPTVLAATGLIDKNILTPTLGSGTLIFRNGRIVTVPPPEPLVPQILVNTNTVRSAVFLMPTPQPVAVKSDRLAHIAPKRREVTQTTFMNSAPIPAIKAFRLEPYPAGKPKAKKRKVVNREESEPPHQAGKVQVSSKTRKNLKRKEEPGTNAEDGKVPKVTAPDKTKSSNDYSTSVEAGVELVSGGASTDVTDREERSNNETKEVDRPEGDKQIDIPHAKSQNSGSHENVVDEVVPRIPSVTTPVGEVSSKETSFEVPPVADPGDTNGNRDLPEAIRSTETGAELNTVPVHTLPVTKSEVVPQTKTSEGQESPKTKSCNVEKDFNVSSVVSNATINHSDDTVLTVKVTDVTPNVASATENIFKPQVEKTLTPTDINRAKCELSQKPQVASSFVMPVTPGDGTASILNQKPHEASLGSSDFRRPQNQPASQQQNGVTYNPGHVTSQNAQSYNNNCQLVYPFHANKSSGTELTEKNVSNKPGSAACVDSYSQILRESSKDDPKLRCCNDKGTSMENNAVMRMPTFSNQDKIASRPSTCEESSSQRDKDVKCAKTCDGSQSNNEMTRQIAPTTTTIAIQSTVNSNKQTVKSVDSAPTTSITSNAQMYPPIITGSSDVSRPENMFNYDTPLSDPFFNNFMGKDVPIPPQNTFSYNSFTAQAPPRRSVARQLFPPEPLCSITNSYNLLNNRQNEFDVNNPLNSSNASQMFQFSTYSSANSFRDPPLFSNDFLSTPTKSTALESTLNDKDHSSSTQNFNEAIHSSANINCFTSIACNFSVSNVPVSGSMCISGDSTSSGAPFTMQQNKQCPAESRAADSRPKQNAKSCGSNGSFSMNVITSNSKPELKAPYQKPSEAQNANFHYFPPVPHSHTSQITPESSYNFALPPPAVQPPQQSGGYSFHGQSNSATVADKNPRKTAQSVATQKSSISKDFNVNPPANGLPGGLRDNPNQYQSNSFQNAVCEQYASHPAKVHHPISNVNMGNFNNGGTTQQTSNNQGVQTQQSYLCNNSSLVNQNTNQLPPGSQSFPTRNTAHHLVHSDKKYPKGARMSQDAPYGVSNQQVMMKTTSRANVECNMAIHPQKYQNSSAGPTQTTTTISFQNPQYSTHNVFSHSNTIGQKAYQGSSYGNPPNTSVPQSIYSNPTSVGSQYTASTVVTSSHSHDDHNHNLFSHMNVNANVNTSQMSNHSNYASSAQIFPNVEVISQQGQDNRNRKSHSNVQLLSKPSMPPQSSGQFVMQNMKVSHVGTSHNFSMSNASSYQQSAVQSRNDSQQPLSKRVPNQTLNLNYSQTPSAKQNLKNDVTPQYPPASMNSVPPKQCDYPLASILTGLNDPMLNNQLVNTEVTNQHKIPDSTSSEKNPCGDKVIDKQYSTNTEGNTFKADSVCNGDFLRNKDNERNSFIPIIEDVRLNSDFSNDLFSSLQVPTGGAHSDSISPTAAFLLAFPLVSTSKNTDNLAEADQPDNNTSTPTTILQIGNIDPPNSEMFHPLEFGKEIEASEYLSVQDKCKRKEMSVKQKKQQNMTTYTNYSYPTMSGDFNIHYDQTWNENQDKSKPVERKKNDKSGTGKFNNGGNIEFCKQDKKKKSKISVNWMAVPEANETFSKDAESSSYPAANLQFPMDIDGLPDLCTSKKNNNVYSWSPSKTLLPLDSSLMIPSTLPTLVGDLALGTTTPSDPYNKRCDAGQSTQLKKTQDKPPEKREVPKAQNNFLSVSQLVDPKSKKKLPEAKCKKTEKKKAPCQKRKEPNDPCMYPDNLLPPIGWDKYRYRNNYSAEALIGTQDVNESLNISYQQNPTQAYFPGSEVNQEHAQQYQNSFNFTQNQFSSFVAEEFQNNNFSVNQPPNGSASKRPTIDKREGRCRDETAIRYLGNATPYQQPPHQPYVSTALTSSASHPAHFTSNTTTSVTNFNLSTIFPEINERTGSQGQAQQGQQHNSAQHPHTMNSFTNNNSTNNYRNHNL